MEINSLIVRDNIRFIIFQNEFELLERQIDKEAEAESPKPS